MHENTHTHAGTSETVPTQVQVVSQDAELPWSYEVSLYDPADFAPGILCYAQQGVPPIRSRKVAAGDTEGVTFVLKDGKHVIEILIGPHCFYETLTVSGGAQAVLYVEDLFYNNFGQWPNLIVLGNYSGFTSVPHPASVEYAIYDASECPGPPSRLVRACKHRLASIPVGASATLLHACMSPQP